MRIVHIEVGEIFVPEDRRPVDREKVAKLADSVSRLGMLQPITVAYEGGRIRLVAGAHRLAAAKRLRWSEVPAVVALGDAVELRLVEIAENLHRAELTALGRDELLAEWIRLTEGVSSQVETKPQGGRPEGGVSAAARELGVSKSDAHRAVAVASLVAEAKAVAREIGLDNNRSALFDAAKENSPEKEIESLKNRAARPKASLKSDPLPKTHSGIRDALMQTRLELTQARSRIAELEAENRHLRDRIAVLEAADRTEARAAQRNEVADHPLDIPPELRRAAP